MNLSRLEGRRVIVVNDNYLRCPWADLLYFCDHKWWKWHTAKPEFCGAFAAFRGLKVTMDRRVYDADPSVKWVKNGGWNEGKGLIGIDPRPTHLRNGRNGGYQALHLAVHLGAKRIVLLGYDMKHGANGEGHWFGEHRDEEGRERREAPAIMALWGKNFATLVGPLRERGVEVLNATPNSAIECFPKVPLERCLQPRAVTLCRSSA